LGLSGHKITRHKIDGPSDSAWKCRTWQKQAIVWK